MRSLLGFLALLSTSALAVASCTSHSSSGSADALRLCAFDSACTSDAALGFGFLCDGWAIRGSLSADAGSQHLDVPTVACLEAATTCAAWNACSAPTPAQAALCGGKSGGVCSGNIALSGCPSPTMVEDCGGLSCHTDVDGAGAECGRSTCDPTTSPLHCEGNTLVGCDSAAGQVDDLDCTSLQGFNYVSGGFAPNVAGACENAKCVGGGAACTQDESSCSGSVLSECVAGSTVTFDCSTLSALGTSLTCATTQFKQAYCATPMPDCDGSAKETCVDGVITFCLFGTTTTLDCKAYGLSGCSEIDGPTGPSPSCVL